MNRGCSHILFCPPRLPLRLAEATPATIGRHSSCDFVLRGDHISRRHAEVFHEAGTFRIRDLGSTNGTFLNGERVECAETLFPGAKVEIGSAIVVFCQVQGEVGTLDDESSAALTMLAERPRVASPGAFQGNLSEIPPDALLQLLEMGRKSGLLELTSRDGRSRLWVDQGHPVHAEAGSDLGFDAAVAMIASGHGRFRFEPQIGTEERSINASVTEVLLEASRLQGESSR